jgi:hypothetical protein
MTDSNIVMGTQAPFDKVTLAGNLTPGLLLFSAAGKGANLVPLPAKCINLFILHM